MRRLIGALAALDRLIPRFVLTEPLQAVAALIVTAVAFVAVIRLAGLAEWADRVMRL